MEDNRVTERSYHDTMVSVDVRKDNVMGALGDASTRNECVVCADPNCNSTDGELVAERRSESAEAQSSCVSSAVRMRRIGRRAVIVEGCGV